MKIVIRRDPDREWDEICEKHGRYTCTPFWNQCPACVDEDEDARAYGFKDADDLERFVESEFGAREAEAIQDFIDGQV